MCPHHSHRSFLCLPHPLPNFAVNFQFLYDFLELYIDLIGVFVGGTLPPPYLLILLLINFILPKKKKKKKELGRGQSLWKLYSIASKRCLLSRHVIKNFRAKLKGSQVALDDLSGNDGDNSIMKMSKMFTKATYSCIKTLGIAWRECQIYFKELCTRSSLSVEEYIFLSIYFWDLWVEKIDKNNAKIGRNTSRLRKSIL